MYPNQLIQLLSLKQVSPLVLTFLLFHTVISQTVTRGPYLQSVTPTSIKVKWRTNTATNSRVYYGTNANNLTQFKDVTGNVMDHTVMLSNLQPYTEYFYSIGTSAQVLSGPSASHHFKTAPNPGTEGSYRFWAIGDFGKANQQQVDVMNSYVNYTGSIYTDVWLWLGDNAYDTGTDAEYQTKVFDVYSNIMKYMPFYPCPGNHDYGSVCPIPCANGNPQTHTGPYYKIVDVPINGEAGGVPSGYELYYSFDYGNVHFISLNSELGSTTPAYDWIGAFNSNFSGSEMTNWLVADLQANQQPWVIAYWHQVGYTKGSHDSDDFWELYMTAMRENIHPILESYGVDMVICGHSHVYERSYLIKGHYGLTATWDPATMLVDSSSGNFDNGEPYVKKTYGTNANEGTVYLTVGNSGNYENNPPLNHPAMYFGYGGNGMVGSLVLDVHGNRLDAKYLKSDGSIIDEFTIIKASGCDSVVSGTSQDISISTGWNIISSYIEPALPSLTDVFRNISSEILIVKNGAGDTYIPLLGINTIGNWNVEEGYKVRASSPTTLTIGCQLIDPVYTPIMLNAGWNMISYLDTCPIPIDSSLNTVLSSILLVKDGAGNSFIPSLGINNIGDMQPGKGYKIRMSNSVTLRYPPNSQCRDTCICPQYFHCMNGICICLAGYEGDFCQINSSDKFIGSYVVIDSCTNSLGGQQIQNFQSFITNGTQIDELTINNFGNLGLPVSAVITDPTNLIIPQQVVGGLSISSGFGEYDTNTGQIEFEYNYQLSGSSYSCTATFLPL